MADDPRDAHPDGAVAVVRRPPFSDNPRVGARGLRTQQRILDAGLRAFGEAGYHGCTVERITRLARCSRVAFYQYFESKEDVFRQLSGQVARQVSASTEALEPLTPDAAGRAALRAWIARYAEIYARYEPVFHAVESDDVLAGVAGRVGMDNVARIHSRLETTSLPPRQLDPVIVMLLEALNHTLGVVGILASVVPDAYPRVRVEEALTDVWHRTLFGTRAGVNVHDAGGPPPPALDLDPRADDLLGRDGHEPESSGARTSALVAIVDAGRGVFVARGYHNTRVDDLVDAAGVSHGAFYRYFRNKDQLARLLAQRAAASVGTVLTEIPDATVDGSGGRAALRRWLRRYHATHSNEAAMLRVWVDAALQDPALRAASAPSLDWGRRRLARWLAPRGFGDLDMDGVVLVALLGIFGARRRSAADVEAAAHIIERGLLGR